VSGAAVLIVDATPLIFAGPQSVVISPGGDAEFSATADGPSLEYQWWHNSVPVAGAISAILHITSAGPGDQGEYFAVVSNFAGSATSSVSTLTFDESALKILAQPQTQSVEEGSSISFSAVVSGVPPFSYQWLKNGAAIEGATHQTYTITNAHFQDAGAYSLIVTNDYRMVASAEAQLTIREGAASPRLTIARVNAQNPSVTITFPAETSRSYRLLQSTNLTDWNVLQTKSAASSGPLHFFEPAIEQPNRFYKIATP
jgi:hypothetical protein